MRKRITLTVLTSLTLSLAVTAVRAQPSEKVVVAGTGDSQKLLRLLAAAYERVHPEIIIDVPDSIGSSGGIKALLAGKTDLARVARPLKPAEAAQGLTYRPFALSPIVFVVHPSVQGLKDLTSEQILAIYRGDLTDWQQLGAAAGKIYPIIREKGDSSLKVLEDRLAGFKDLAEPKAKICFTTPETIRTLTRHEGTIGFVPLSMVDPKRLTVVAVDGIAPTFQSITEGTYPYVVPFALVYRAGRLTETQRDFLEFLFTVEAQKILLDHGTFPWIQP